MTTAIRVDNLSKRYHLGARRGLGYRTLRESIMEGISAPWRRLRGAASGAPSAETHWALKDVSFEIQPGEVVGVIGRNGAGKSTLLKILSRITEPHSGRVELRGRVGSLLEVGVGFHHELTGRENIFLNGAIFGMSRREIARKFDAIVDFAEVGPFLDTPVKRYSSGMYVRLAFAVASHMEPEILLVDEVLAVGDAVFQKKCLGKMDEVSRTGRTVVFVSHNMATILNLCSKVIVLERGRLAFGGGLRGRDRVLHQQWQRTGPGRGRPLRPPQPARGQHTDPGRCPLAQQPGATGRPAPLRGARLVRGRARPALLRSPRLRSPSGSMITSVAGSSRSPPTSRTRLPSGTNRFRRVVCYLDQLPLTPGRYCLTLNAGPPHALWSDMVDQALWFDVEATDYYGNGRLPNPDWGRFLVRSRWEAVE